MRSRSDISRSSPRFLPSFLAPSISSFLVLFLLPIACLFCRNAHGLATPSSAGELPAVPFSSSDLPIVAIDTDGREIPVDHRIVAGMRVVWNGEGRRNHLSDPPNEYDGRIEIELQGKSSLMFPKNSFRLETQDAAGENLNVSLLGMPSENDWILHAPYTDKTLMRNVLVYTLAGEMGAYAPRVRFCEVILNDEYHGVYVFTERIKRDASRIDMARLAPEDVGDTEITGGYIFKKDKSDPGDNVIAVSNGVDFIIIEPKGDEIVPQQTSWLRDHLASFSNALSADGDYEQYIDVLSFVDNVLMVELAKNVDGYRSSSYFYKDRNARIVAGPVWDYDLSLGNADLLQGWTPIGWYYPLIDRTRSYWYGELLGKLEFYGLCAERWRALRRDRFHTPHLYSLIDEWTELLREAQARNFARYQILGTYVGANPGFPESGSMEDGVPTSGGPTTWDEEIAYMEEFVERRLRWIDEQFGLEFVQVGIDVAEGARGSVCLNNREVSDGVFEGRLTRDVPVLLTARPLSGYEFARWEAREITQYEMPVLVPAGSRWRYLDDGSDQGTEWHTVSFDDSHWNEGRAPLGYGGGNEATRVSFGPDGGAKHVTTYFRIRFHVENPGVYHSLTLDLLRDDGAVVYLNGEEVVRSNMPDTAVDRDVLASARVGGEAEGSYERSTIAPSHLVAGENLVAVEVHQADPGSPDMSFDLELAGTTLTLGEAIAVGADEELSHRPARDTWITAVFTPAETAGAGPPAERPQSYRLGQSYPNPFNSRTVIAYQLPSDSRVDLEVYSVAGQRVATLVAGQQPAGRYRYEWDAAGLGSGVYLYRLAAGGFVQTRKCVLLK